MTDIHTYIHTYIHTTQNENARAAVTYTVHIQRIEEKKEYSCREASVKKKKKNIHVEKLLQRQR